MFSECPFFMGSVCLSNSALKVLLNHSKTMY